MFGKLKKFKNSYYFWSHVKILNLSVTIAAALIV